MGECLAAAASATAECKTLAQLELFLSNCCPWTHSNSRLQLSFAPRDRGATMEHNSFIACVLPGVLSSREPRSRDAP